MEKPVLPHFEPILRGFLLQLHNLKLAANNPKPIDFFSSEK